MDTVEVKVLLPFFYREKVMLYVSIAQLYTQRQIQMAVKNKVQYLLHSCTLKDRLRLVVHSKTNSDGCKKGRVSIRDYTKKTTIHNKEH